MKNYYIAVTYDVCPHLDLLESMNEYELDTTREFAEQAKEYAALDVVPLVKVYESTTVDFDQMTLYEEYEFKEYDCHCDE